jgi:integrative and conjugative element protein (TIGR02256 family)
MFVTNNKIHKKYFSLLVSKSVQEVFHNYRQTESHHLEACGVLIGNHKIDNNVIYLKYVTIPQTKDLRRRYSFKLDSFSHQDILDKHFKASGYEDVYIGTWHTHPEDNPKPSYIDIKDWEKQYKVNRHLFNKMVFAIVGMTRTNFWIIENDNLYEVTKRRINYEQDN